MSLSVVVPTFNQRAVLTECLDAIERHTTDAETIVVNGPSTDGTSGMIHERSDVDVLIELSTRNVNVARNVGVDRAGSPYLALLDPRNVVTPDWEDTLLQHLGADDDAISGPVLGDGGADASTPLRHERATDHAISSGNVAITRNALLALDGFDEYLDVGGMADFARRLQGNRFRVAWHPAMAVERVGPASNRTGGGHDVDHAWFETDTTDWGRVYRSMTYRVVKNDGLGPRQVGHVLAAAVTDGIRNGRDVFRGVTEASRWYRNGWSVLRNAAGGIHDGYRARRTDRTPARNPYGLSNSAGDDVIVDLYDWR